MDGEQALQALGFSEYEARAYVGLLRFGPLNGYELAKRTGLPRANVYEVLSRLEERGAVLRSATPEGLRYRAVDPEELLARLRDATHRRLERARAALRRVASASDEGWLWNVAGYPAVLEHARAQVEGARGSLWIALGPPEAAALQEAVARAEGRGVQVVTLCLEACGAPCGGCHGAVHRYRVPPERDTRWLVVVADGEEAFAAEVASPERAHGVRTRNRLVVQLVAWYMRYSVALGRALEDAGVPPDRMASLEKVLRRLRAEGRVPRWLAHLVRATPAVKGGGSGNA
jgi:DNA-binding MarR family transcriptional regulator